MTFKKKKKKFLFGRVYIADSLVFFFLSFFFSIEAGMQSDVHKVETKQPSMIRVFLSFSSCFTCPVISNNKTQLA